MKLDTLEIGELLMRSIYFTQSKNLEAFNLVIIDKSGEFDGFVSSKILSTLDKQD